MPVRSGRSADAPTGEFDTFARTTEVAERDERQFVQLLETLRILDDAEAGYQLRHLSTDTLAAIVRDASKEQLNALEEHRELRRVFLDEIYDRMSQHFLPDKAAQTELVLSWRFSGGNGTGGYDRYQTIIEDGRCRSGRNLARQQHTTLTLCVADFIRLATGNANIATMFVSGRVRVKGDYAPAVRFSSYFDMPKPG